MRETGELLRRFEAGLEPADLSRSEIPAQVLGYGEISTVFRIDGDRNQAYKRMPLFDTRQAAEDYITNYREYCRLLTRAGLNLPQDQTSLIDNSEGSQGPVVLYIIQEQLPAERFAHRLINDLAPEQVTTLFQRISAEISKIMAFNAENRPRWELALDGQLSNWVLLEDGSLIYIDTNTPLYRKDGVEQLDPELFLKSAPAFLRWIIRWLFLEEVMNRYYNPHQVLIDLVANLYKEQRADLVPRAVEVINGHLQKGLRPLTPDEVETYYRGDKRIWSLFLTFRRIDRWLKTRLLGGRYEFILPGKIDR